MTPDTKALAGQMYDQTVTAVARSGTFSGARVEQIGGKLRPQMVPMIAALLTEIATKARSQKAGGEVVAEEMPAADLWSAPDRTTANLAAMELLGAKSPDQMTAQDRRVLAGYSGWGGLSIEKVKKWPSGVPRPEKRGLIHEYYTPSSVAKEVARVVRGLLPSLPQDDDGKIMALEPSAGIGRFLAATAGLGLDWTAVEYSAVSSKLLKARFPRAHVHEGPFEGWVAEHGPSVAGKLGLVLSNPPYGVRGESKVLDPAKEYRAGKMDKAAAWYFMRRTSDLLAEGGVGVYLVPGGFMSGTGKAMRDIREAVLRRHHLMSAYRLPSGIFPGAMLVIDLIFLRSRGGVASEVAEADLGVLDGGYFKHYPAHILGKEVGNADEDGDDVTKKPRYGYQVLGDFTGLPELVERPMSDLNVTAMAGYKSRRAQSLTRVVTESDDLSPDLVWATKLGLRVDRYLADVAQGGADAEVWRELHTNLTAWKKAHGNPHHHKGLGALFSRGNVGARRFLAAWGKDGALAAGLSVAPAAPEKAYKGDTRDLVALATHLRASRNGLLTVPELVLGFKRENRTTLDPQREVVGRLGELVQAGWAFDGAGWQELVPPSDYYSGWLWERYDRAKEAKDRPNWIKAQWLHDQAERLLLAISPEPYSTIEVNPRAGWFPVEVLGRFLSEQPDQAAKGYRVQLYRDEGLYQLILQNQTGKATPVAYDQIKTAETSWGSLSNFSRNFVGWLNHDKELFAPKRVEGEVLEKKRAEWEESALNLLQGWCGSDEEARAQLEEAYNRAFRGFVTPTYSPEPIHIARWGSKKRPHPYQNAAARRVLTNRRGVVALDVGLGKTLTALMILGRAKQEGWARRPVILVPKSILVKWKKDIEEVYPDFNVALIGGYEKTIERGRNKGRKVVESDTPKQRGEKWLRFQAGEFDVALVSYPAFNRTQMNLDELMPYVRGIEAVMRDVKLSVNSSKETRNEPTERKRAIVQERLRGFLADKLALPAGQSYDEGVAWDDLGVDLLVVDESQNFKNLYFAEPRGGGPVEYMGAGDSDASSKRAWGLDLRAATVRARSGGGGVVLLSATPAKNSPLEFYTAINFTNPSAWTRLGIRNPEQWIERFVDLQTTLVASAGGKTGARVAAKGFKNLHELRSVIERECEFRTAEEVKLRMPASPPQPLVEVTLSDEQKARYTKLKLEYQEAAKRMAKGGEGAEKEKNKLLAIMHKMADLCLHPALLDDKWDWDSADRLPAAMHASPRLEAVAEKVTSMSGCGHIIFCDTNLAVQKWLRSTLIQAGVRPERIAYLNAKTAPDPDERYEVAVGFNGDIEDKTATTPRQSKVWPQAVELGFVGDPSQGREPLYDVVICNAVANEGIDLQKRTCAIHHVDLPWEPATLQQRNGRGVRQGNAWGSVDIFYYVSPGTVDGVRLSKIAGKRSWLISLVKGQDRTTNNPFAAEEDLALDDAILEAVYADPREAIMFAALNRVQTKQAEIATEAKACVKALHTAAELYEKAAQGGPRAAALLQEAEANLARLERAPAEAWPWGELGRQVIHLGPKAFASYKPSEASYEKLVDGKPYLVPAVEGHQRRLFVAPGLRLSLPSGRNIEFGRVNAKGAWMRYADQIGWGFYPMEMLAEQMEKVAYPSPGAVAEVVRGLPSPIKEHNDRLIAKAVAASLGSLTPEQARDGLIAQKKLLGALPGGVSADWSFFKTEEMRHSLTAQALGRLGQGWSDRYDANPDHIKPAIAQMNSTGWRQAHIDHASRQWAELVWTQASEIKRLASSQTSWWRVEGSQSWSSDQAAKADFLRRGRLLVPAIIGGALMAVDENKRSLLGRDDARILPQTDQGWEQFVRLAGADPEGGWGGVALGWWDRRLPKDAKLAVVPLPMRSPGLDRSDEDKVAEFEQLVDALVPSSHPSSSPRTP